MTGLVSLNPDDGDAMHNYLVYDALHSLLKAITSVVQATEQDLKKYDEWAAEATHQGIAPLMVIFNKDINIDTAMASFFGGAFLYNFPDYWSKNFDSKPYFDYLYLVWNDRTHEDSILLTNILEATELLYNFAVQEDMSDQTLIRVGNALHTVAIGLEQTNKFTQALANLHTSVSFMQAGDLPGAIDRCKNVIELARKAGQHNLASNLFIYANLCNRVALEDPTREIDAFDATEQLLRYMLAQQQHNNIQPDDDLLAKVKQYLASNIHFKPLYPLFAGLSNVELPPDMTDFSAVYKAIWDKTFVDWATQIFESANYLMVQIANKRFELLPKSNNIEVFWNNWTINYGRMLQAIPHNESLPREECVNEILMDLKHELTHVYTLFGSVGTVLNMMRWLIVELEIQLFVNHYELSQVTEDAQIQWKNIMQSKEPVQLMRPDALGLAYAERSVAIEAKIRCIEQVWLPWYEGIAVFGETVDNPELDPEFESFPTTVLKNMVDLNAGKIAEEEGKSLLEVFDRHKKRMEAMYAKALNTEGVHRLHAYLTVYHKHYLPGYLVVRSVLSKWRNTSKRPIRGDEAFRLLLHITRFSGFEVLPDLGLPIDKFREQVVTKHLEWVSTVGNLDEKELIAFFDLDAKPNQPYSYWSKGKLVITERDDPAEKDEAALLQKARDCMSSLTGADRPVDGFEKADDTLKEIIKDIAEITVERANDKGMINKGSAAAMLTRYTILPIAQATCPFWLISDGNQLACKLRTKAMDKEHGTPSYNLVSFQIKPDDFEWLKKRIIETGVQYLTVTRAVLLGGFTDRTLANRHFLVYQYEDWMHVESMGMFWLSDVNETVQAAMETRFRSNVVFDYREAINGKNNPCSIRTKQWIENNDWQNVDLDGKVINLQPWADHVQNLSDEVLNKKDNSLVDEISFGLLKMIFKNEACAVSVLNGGLGFLNNHDPLLMEELISLLFRSALSPVPATPSIRKMDATVRQIFGPFIEQTNDNFDFIKL